MIIRDADEKDWVDIYTFFSQIVNEGRTYAYGENLSIDDARALWMEKAPGRTVAAVEGGHVGGTAKMGPNRPGRGSHVATASFMVDPQHQGRGVGAALGAHVISWARDAGYASIQFNAVAETNVAAVHLWKALGFTILTTVPRAFNHRDHGRVGLHLMFREL